MELNWRSVSAALVAATGLAGVATAGDPLPSETLVVRPTIESKGPLLLTGGERILVADAGELKWQGVVGLPGWRGQFLLNKGGQVIVTNSWWERGSTGKRTDAVEMWDLATLEKLPFEIEVPPRLALRGNDSTMLGLSSDEKFLLLQNATPATSVSVVDLQAKKFAAEIPMPGCFGIYPAMTAPGKFVALCGDGTAATVLLDAGGKSRGVARSEAFFDADVDPLFPKAVRNGDTLYFASFNGVVYQVDISGPTAKLASKFSLVEGVPGGWKPASENLATLAPAAGVMFISMFPGSGDGDHRVNGKQVWAVDLAAQKVLSRSTVKATNGIAYVDGPVPMLLSNNPEDRAIDKYIVQPAAGHALFFDRQWVVNSGPNLLVR